MRALRTTSLLLFVALAGCKKPLTYVHLHILPAANEPAGITRIDLQMTFGEKQQTITLDDGGAVLALPADVTLQVGGGSGQLAITAVASNAQGAEVDRATSTIQVASGSIVESNLQLPGGKPVVQPAEDQHVFSAVTAGAASSPVAVSFHNAGFQPSGNIAVLLGGTGASQFNITSDTCSGATLAPGASCSVTIVFQPTLSGAIAATLTLSATPGGNTVVALSGTGNPNPQTLSVTIKGGGQGSVTAAPSGLTCSGGACSGTYDYATSVTLTPVPATGSHFAGWLGACGGAGACTLGMTQAQSAVAQFELDREAFSLAISGNGTVDSSDANLFCTSGAEPSCSATYLYGAALTLTATAAAGSHFVSWSDPACAGANPCALTVTGPETLTATFALNTHTVRVTLSGTGNGTLSTGETPTPKISAAWSAPGPQTGTSSATYDFGDVFTLNATTDAVSQVSGGGITGDASNTCNGPPPCSVTVGDSDISIDMVIDHLPVQVPVSIGGNGSGTVSDSASGFSCASTQGSCPNDGVTYGAASAVFTAAPDVGSTTAWGGACSGQSGNTCTVAGPITSTFSVSATFTLISETLAVATNGGNGTGTVACTKGGAAVSCGASFNYGDTVVATATASSPSSQFGSWSGCSSVNGAQCTKILNSTAGTNSITAAFTLVPETLTITASGNGTPGYLCNVNATGNVACTSPMTFKYNDSVVVTANPPASTNFGGWSSGNAGCTGTGTCGPLVMTAAKTTTAAFTLKPELVTATFATGTGTGTVSSSPAGLNTCSTTCSANFNYGSTVTLTASPAINSNAAWTAGTGCTTIAGNVCTITNIQTATSPTITFSVKTFTVTASVPGTASGNVKSSPAGINCGNGSSACSMTVTYGASLTFTQTPGAGAFFTGWTGDCPLTTGNCPLTATSALNVVGNFNASNCATGGAAQAFDFTMHGCAGSVSFANRANLCAPGTHVCTSAEWVQNVGGATQLHNYWTDDALGFVQQNSVGPCGPGSCNSGLCFATLANATATVPTTPCAGGGAHVCVGNGGFNVSDPEGNTCVITGCGLDGTYENRNFGGCGSSAGTLCCIGTVWTVDAVNGSDANPGTAGLPFKTITKALSAATAGSQVKVLPGTYDTVNGETFPIRVPPGVSLVGDEANRGAGSTPTRIVGCGGTAPHPAALFLGASASVAGFTIACSTGGNGDHSSIVLNAANPAVHENTINGTASNGIELVSGASAPVISMNVITGTFQGIYAASGSPGAKVENNSITGNFYGVVGAQLGLNLGDPSGGNASVGNNVLSCSSASDVWVGSSGTVNASFDHWDHVPPTQSTSSQSGFDIFNSSGLATINTGSATLAPTTCNP